MKEIVSDSNLVAACGLYCGACGKYLKGKCPGCLENEKASWCKIRSCIKENNYSTCADCTEHSDPLNCKMFNNFISKLFGMLLNSDRAKCIQMIKDDGLIKFTEYMTENGFQTLKRK